jgi:hypothetical protein
MGEEVAKYRQSAPAPPFVDGPKTPPANSPRFAFSVPAGASERGDRTYTLAATTARGEWPPRRATFAFPGS